MGKTNPSMFILLMYLFNVPMVWLMFNQEKHFSSKRLNTENLRKCMLQGSGCKHVRLLMTSVFLGIYHITLQDLVDTKWPAVKKEKRRSSCCHLYMYSLDC